MKTRLFKKSQITFFIILGIVIVGMIFLGYYFMQSGAEKKSEVQQEKQIDIQAKIKKYNKYIDSCLEQTTIEGLVLLGKQGGAIFEGKDSIPGALQISEVSSLDYKDKTGTETTVVYGLTAPKFLGNHLDVPQYPYGIVKLVKDPKAVYGVQNPFGNYPGFFPLIPLCDSNRLTAAQKQLFSCGTHTNSYDLNKIEAFSIQDLLEKYVDEKIKSCIKLENFPELKELVEQKKALLGKIMTNIRIREEGVEATLTLSGKIINDGQQSEIAFMKNKLVVPIRIKQIHALVSYLIKNDINNIFFDMTLDAADENMQLCDAIDGNGNLIKYQCLKQKMKIYRLNDVGIANNLQQPDKDPVYDDLLVIEDSSKLIDGEPYKFQIAIQNRIPAVDLIKDLQLAKNSGITSKNLLTLGKYVDLVIGADLTASLDIKAYDPDEDFHIAGIMEQKSYALYSAGSCGGISIGELSDSSIGDLISTLSNCEFLETEEPPNNQKLDIITFPTAGYYAIKVIACDNANKCDYQLVRVLVIL